MNESEGMYGCRNHIIKLCPDSLVCPDLRHGVLCGDSMTLIGVIDYIDKLGCHD